MTEQELIDKGINEGKKSFDFLANQINKHFDWGKVHKAMIATDWHWVLGQDEFGNDNRGIPDIKTIKNTAYALLKSAYEAEKGSIGTGGFTAGWDNGELYLVFTLEEWASQD